MAAQFPVATIAHGAWKPENTLCVGTYLHAESEAQLLDTSKYGSVSAALAALNAGMVQCQSFCSVFSHSRKAYYLLWPSGMPAKEVDELFAPYRSAGVSREGRGDGLHSCLLSEVSTAASTPDNTNVDLRLVSRPKEASVQVPAKECKSPRALSPSCTKPARLMKLGSKSSLVRTSRSGTTAWELSMKLHQEGIVDDSRCSPGELPSSKLFTSDDKDTKKYLVDCLLSQHKDERKMLTPRSAWRSRSTDKRNDERQTLTPGGTQCSSDNRLVTKRKDDKKASSPRTTRRGFDKRNDKNQALTPRTTQDSFDNRLVTKRKDEKKASTPPWRSFDIRKDDGKSNLTALPSPREGCSSDDKRLVTKRKGGKKASSPRDAKATAAQVACTSSFAYDPCSTSSTSRVRSRSWPAPSKFALEGDADALAVVDCASAPAQVASKEIPFADARLLSIEEFSLDQSDFNPSRAQLKVKLLKKLRLENAVFNKLDSDNSGCFNDDIWVVSDATTTGLVLKLVPHNGTEKTDREKYLDLQRMCPDILTDFSLTFPVKILQLKEPSGAINKDLIVMRKAVGIQLTQYMWNNFNSGRGAELLCVFHNFGKFLKAIHSTYRDVNRSMQHGNCHPSNVFYDEVSRVFTLVDVVDFGFGSNSVEGGEDDVQLFLELLQSLTPWYGKSLIEDCAVFFRTGYCSGRDARTQSQTLPLVKDKVTIEHKPDSCPLK